MLEVFLKGNLNINSINRHISKFIDNERMPLSSEFIVDICDIGFITPSGITALTNVLAYLNQLGCKVSVRYPIKHSDTVVYLDDCGFFRYFAGKPLRENASCRPTTMPLRVLEYPEYDSWLTNTVFPWLSRCLGFDIQTRWLSFYNVVGEIFNNINDHAGANACIASTIMQHYPANNTVEIAISDFGVGIPARVRSVLPDIEYDDDTILKAVEDNFSSRSSPRNRGAGLHTVIKNAVDFNRGRVSIISGFGAIEFIPGKRSRRLLSQDGVGYVNYPGTLLRLVLRTDTINQEETYEEDMSW